MRIFSFGEHPNPGHNNVHTLLGIYCEILRIAKCSYTHYCTTSKLGSGGYTKPVHIVMSQGIILCKIYLPHAPNQLLGIELTNAVH